jgi:ABC-2 type transport system ATP-binding protein
MTTNVAVEVKDLTKQFGKLIADNHLNFSVPNQDVFALIGPNGAGKTTLIKMLTTIITPTSGDALVNGISITEHPDAVRANIGYVPQLISADGSLTGYENLLLFAKLYNISRATRKKVVEDAINSMGLADFADNYVHEYSGGMIRRLEIVQAMLHNPKVLFLDEPTSGLDPVARRTVWEHLQEIHAKLGITIILTTHDMQEAEFLCNRVAIMLKGKLEQIGTTQELKSSLGPDATLSDVFIQYAGSSMETQNAYKENVARRRTEQRRG